MCGGVLPGHLSQAGEGSVLFGVGVNQGLTDPASVPLWADPIGGCGPGHFVLSAVPTLSQDLPLGGAGRSRGYVGGLHPSFHSILVDGGGLTSQVAVFPWESLWHWRAMCVYLSDCQSSSQRTLFEGFVPFFPRPSLLSRILAWASEPPPSLSYIGLAGLGG